MPRGIDRDYGVWKDAAVALVSVVLTGMGAWLSFGRDKVDRAEMEKYVESAGPYQKDRALILESAKDAKAAAATLATQVTVLSVEQAKQGQKVDQVLGLVRELVEDRRGAKRPKDP